ncbi:hypothetical protein J6590_008018 [Homalodisca vitripennis]|nr:hypothetical protein J6590_008018 [Homalodisca vitripennis]
MSIYYNYLCNPIPSYCSWCELVPSVRDIIGSPYLNSEISLSTPEVGRKGLLTTSTHLHPHPHTIPDEALHLISQQEIWAIVLSNRRGMESPYLNSEISLSSPEEQTKDNLAREKRPGQSTQKWGGRRYRVRPNGVLTVVEEIRFFHGISSSPCILARQLQ